MTDREKNIAIAEWMGVKYHKPTEQEIKSGSHYQYEPDYCNDLNAIHEVELKLPPNNSMHGRIVFDNILMTICGSHQACVSSTAPQRAEALLKTIGKWKE